MKKKKYDKFNVFRFICLIAYVLCAIVLIVESLMDGNSSANQSNAVGGTIADIINQIGGDSSEKVAPTSLTIDNKISSSYVNDTYQINTTILPEETTNKSIEYSSSNSSVATINNEGLITFHKSGEVSIFASSQEYKDIKDSMHIVVSNVDVSDFLCSINANYVDSTYILYVGNTYFIDTTFYPLNATFKNISFSVDSNPYLSIDEKGNIKALSYSKNNEIVIKVNSGLISKDIRVKVEYENVNLLTDFALSKDNFEIYVSQSASVSISPIPSDATFNNYSLISSDPSIVSVVSSTSFVGKKAGNTTIKVISTTYEDIVKFINVTVKSKPIVEDFVLKNLSYDINVGNSKTIEFLNMNKYADITSITFTSNDSTIASVSNKGVIKALKEGKTSITIKSKTMTSSIIINVIDNSADDDYTTNFDINYLKGENPVINISSSSYDLSTYFAVEKFYYKEGHETKDKTIKFTLNNQFVNNGCVINNNKLTVSEIGEVNVLMTHTASNISKNVKLIAISDFNLIYENEMINLLNDSPFNLKANSNYDFYIKSNKEQQYDISYDGDSSLAIISNSDSNSFSIGTSGKDGSFNIIITPIINDKLISNASKTFVFTISHIYTDSLIINVKDDKNELALISNHQLSMYVNDKLYIHVILNDNTTNYNLNYQYSDPDVLSVENNGFIKVKKIGKTTITITDTLSNCVDYLEVTVNNKIILDSENILSFDGKNASYDEVSNQYSLTNGASGKIKLNFSSESTYKEVSYYSSNEKVLSVGKDGKLTPHKEGQAIITIICNDTMQKEIKIEVVVNVKAQPVIENLSSFLYKIRKSVGHFGAFLVLGIFSTITYLLYLRKWKWSFSIPINFISGFALAALTEIIQLFVPGRCGALSDVYIDFTGFAASSILLTIIILLTYLFMYLKKKKTGENKHG